MNVLWISNKTHSGVVGALQLLQVLARVWSVPKLNQTIGSKSALEELGVRDVGITKARFAR